MIKNKDRLTLLGSFLLLSFLCVGCNSQNTHSGTITSQTDTTTSSQVEANSDTESTEDILQAETIPEETPEKENGLLIPDYAYDEYLTVSAEDDTPILGYNIPIGFTKNADSKAKSAKLTKSGITEQSISIMYNNMTQYVLQKVEENNTEDCLISEQTPIETPVGTFRIFTFDNLDNTDRQYAILPVTEEEGVTIEIYYYEKGIPHFYQDSMDLLLTDLFSEKQSPVEIPADYEYYLHSYSEEPILGVNTVQGYHYSDSSSPVSVSFSSDTYGESSIHIIEYDTMAPIYCGTTDTLTSGILPDTGEIANYYYYTEKGTFETPYGPAKLFDEKGDINPGTGSTYTSYTEIALLRLNGSYILIKYSEIGSDVPTNNIETILSQLF